MGFKAFVVKQAAKFIVKNIHKDTANAVACQKRVFQSLIQTAKDTEFGKDHHFNTIVSYEDFKEQVPIRDYETLKPYIDRVIEGETNVLWKGKPTYLAKTSGTTSGVKYIPITKESMPYHISAARNALLCYVNETGNAKIFDGKMIFLSGSPELDLTNGILTGRLSGIVNHHVPRYLRRNQLPSYETNCIEDWETKLDHIVEETIDQNMTLISGIPPWVQMYFDKLQATNGKKIQEIFPNFSIFVQGGVNYKPYQAKIEQSIGKAIDTIETYPASEGFIAYQDSQNEKGLLLNINAGIFYEFIPVETFHDDYPTRLSLQEVELDKNYAIILTTNAGLWAYNIGDTVKFVSLAPYRIMVTGRIKHFISAFGEHVIAEEVEGAVMQIAMEQNLKIVEFTVAPKVEVERELPHHEWFIEFEEIPSDMNRVRLALDQQLQQKNAYYRDLIDGHILQPLKINCLKKNTFIDYMKSKGKLGGQNKMPRLANNRDIANELTPYILE